MCKCIYKHPSSVESHRILSPMTWTRESLETVIAGEKIYGHQIYHIKWVIMPFPFFCAHTKTLLLKAAIFTPFKPCNTQGGRAESHKSNNRNDHK